MAIEAAAASVAHREGLARAAAGAEEAVWKATTRVSEAHATLAASKNAVAAHMAAVAMGTSAPAPYAIRAARADVADALDQLDACKQALDTLKAQNEAETQRHDFSPANVEAAACTVILAERGAAARDLVVKIERWQRELFEVGSGLEWLSRHGAFPLQQEHGGNFDRVEDPAICATIDQLNSPPAYWPATLRPHDAPFVVPTGANAWAAAFEALKRDAAAPLPD